MGQETLPHVHVKEIHHIGFVVRDAFKTAKYLREVWGFEEFAYAGRSTGKKTVEQRVLRLGSIIFLLTQPIKSNTSVDYWLKYHGEGVDDVAFEVDDASLAHETALKLGARSAGKPLKFYDEHDPEKVIMSHAVIEAPGDVRHTLITSDHYPGIFAPGFVAVDYHTPHASSAGVRKLDHLVWNVPEGEMDHWASFYKRVFGFHRLTGFSEEQISTGQAALRSVVMRSPNGTVTMPINEPVTGMFSHIDEFLRDRKGAGVQHLALLTDNLIETVGTHRVRGVKFIDVPATYYEAVQPRLKAAGLQVEIPQTLISELGRLGILIDGEEKGHLLQTFTNTLFGKGSGLFFEEIQRCGDDGFGAVNFLALFEAIERAAGRHK